MTRKPVTASGTMEKGRLTWDNPKVVAAALKSWEGRCVVTIEPEQETRRLRANRFYFGAVVKAVSDETGQDKEAVHEFFKQTFNGEVRRFVSPVTGEVVEQRIGRSTRKMSVELFREYTDQCVLWCAEFLGLVIDDRDRSRVAS